jgi:ParB family transcriptional regulator, chromosome partitioning protein
MSDEKKGPRLGRGLSALLGDDDDTIATGSPAAAAGSRPVPIEHLHRGRFQPRRKFDAAQLEALAESIRAQGVLQPLLVRPHPERPGEYEILAGERRWRAAQMAQLVDVPVLVREISDREALEIALVENVQRQDLNPIEEARGYQRLVSEFNHTQDDIARATGKSRPHITNTLRLLTLPEAVIEMVEDGKLSAGHARPLVGNPRAELIAHEAVARNLSVRQVEAIAKAETTKRAAKKPGAAASHTDVNLHALEREFETLTGMKTKIIGDGGLGTIIFAFTNLDQIDAFLAKLRYT